jgi:hypothetical protein
MRQLNEQLFRHGWRLIVKTWRLNGHCLYYGCGKSTLARWVRKSCHTYYPPKFWRDVMAEACRRGWAQRRVAAGGHARYIIRYEKAYKRESGDAAA